MVNEKGSRVVMVLWNVSWVHLVKDNDGGGAGARSNLTNILIESCPWSGESLPRYSVRVH